MRALNKFMKAIAMIPIHLIVLIYSWILSFITTAGIATAVGITTRNFWRVVNLNILKQTDFSEFTKAKNLSISGKQMLCDKHEGCLEKVVKNI